MWWYFVVLICIFLRTNNVTNIFLCLLAFHITSLVKYQFRYFYHLKNWAIYSLTVELQEFARVFNIFWRVVLYQGTIDKGERKRERMVWDYNLGSGFFFLHVYIQLIKRLDETVFSTLNNLGTFFENQFTSLLCLALSMNSLQFHWAM